MERCEIIYYKQVNSMHGLTAKFYSRLVIINEKCKSKVLWGCSPITRTDRGFSLLNGFMTVIKAVRRETD